MKSKKSSQRALLRKKIGTYKAHLKDLNADIYFGTDGIRANEQSELLKKPFLTLVGRAFTRWLAQHQQKNPDNKPHILIGRDTRRSGPAIEESLVSGIISAGGSVLTGGILPTPAVFYHVTKTEQFNGGIMITASHNGAASNGIKFFSSDGKLSPENESDLKKIIQEELELYESKLDPEEMIPFIRSTRYALHDTDTFTGTRAAHIDFLEKQNVIREKEAEATYKRIQERTGTYIPDFFTVPPLPEAENTPLLVHNEELEQAYTKFITTHNSPLPDLSDRVLVIDPAHGALYKIAPELFRSLGATVICTTDRPNGKNINHRCGSTELTKLQKAVIAQYADLGIAFDGDGDRIMLVARDGSIKTGDDILALLSQAEKYAPEQTLVGTITSGLDFEQYLKENNKKLLRKPVGDRHVLNGLTENTLLLGGESSGHIIMRDYLEISDGLGTALTVIAQLSRDNGWACETFKPYKTIEQTITVSTKPDLSQEPYSSKIDTLRELLPDGRIIIRYSGTEPLLRITVTDKSEELAEQASKKAYHSLIALIQEN